MDEVRYQGEIFVKPNQEGVAFVHVSSDPERGKNLTGRVLRVFPFSITSAELAGLGMGSTTWVTFFVITMAGELVATDLAHVLPPTDKQAEEIVRRAKAATHG
ncbi:MAG: hypothetical protein NTY66_02285 [Candidatus Vogelbacteria bacterium]|nr:hypothetical protein [Candidatus Vogelbacteria bacterium]